MNYFIVESPLQLLNAIEAKKYFGIENKNTSIILMEGISQDNFDQLKIICDKKEWGEVYFLKYEIPFLGFYKKISDFIKRYLMAKKMKSIIGEKTKIERVFIGDYRSVMMRHFTHICKNEKTYLLDDGNASLVVQESIRNFESASKQYSKLTRLIYLLIGINDDDIFNIHFFSIYNNFENTTLNIYKNLKSKIRSFDKNNLVYFLGNCTPELGIVDYSVYIDSLERVVNWYGDNIRLIYLPHRRESMQKLKIIENELNIKVVNKKLPIEWSIIHEKILPMEIASFYSSALDNCYQIFDNEINFKAFKIDVKYIRKESQKAYKKNFEQYNKYGDNFSIIDLKL